MTDEEFEKLKKWWATEPVRSAYSRNNHEVCKQVNLLIAKVESLKFWNNEISNNLEETDAVAHGLHKENVKLKEMIRVWED